MTAIQSTDYEAFLATKAIIAPDVGFSIAPSQVHHALYDFQRMLVLWALRKGRAIDERSQQSLFA